MNNFGLEFQIYKYDVIISMIWHDLIVGLNIPKCSKTLRLFLENALLKSETGCPGEQESSKSSQNVSISSIIGLDCANIDYSPPHDDFATLSSDRLYRDDIKKTCWQRFVSLLQRLSFRSGKITYTFVKW